MAKQIRVIVSRDGSTRVEAENFQGQGCKAATEAIALAITGPDRDTRDDETKPEFFQESTGQNTIY